MGLRVPTMAESTLSWSIRCVMVSLVEMLEIGKVVEVFRDESDRSYCKLSEMRVVEVEVRRL